MRILTPALLLLISAVLALQAPGKASQTPAIAENMCGPLGSSYMRTTLYFGLNRPGVGNISESQWKRFVRDVVTPRFPQGLTVWEAAGQWRRADGAIVRERSKVLLLMHGDDTAVRGALAAIIEKYKQRFEQESVLWETARVCAAF